MNDIMDMKISGSSAMPGGEYRTVSISGSGKVQGSLRCGRLSSHSSLSSRGLHPRCLGQQGLDVIVHQ